MTDRPTCGRRQSWREWSIGLCRGALTLNEAIADLRGVSHTEHETPLIVKLVENPTFQRPGFEFFNGAVDLHDHDCIHLLLGRGLLPKDEAFVIGFTMGTSRCMTTLEEKSFAWISRNLYPGPYRLSDDDVTVFRKAAHLGFVSNCQSLKAVDFRSLGDLRLDEIRDRVGLEVPLLEAYYRIERDLFPGCAESQRLIPDEPAVRIGRSAVPRDETLQIM